MDKRSFRGIFGLMMREFHLVSNICVGCLHKWCSIIIGMESEQPVEKGIQGE